jgi:predicted unusual protein kinase regulating ubiquinone biosynthesis (AarF/ABC1/UbiB family)
MFNDFRTDYNDGKIRIYDVNVLKEMKAYTNSDLAESNVGLITKHFDLLTSTIIAWQMHKYAQVKSSKKSYKSNYENYINA